MKKILLTGGSMNQNTQVHAIARHLQEDFDCYFTPAYMDYGFVKRLNDLGLANNTVLSARFRCDALDYFNSHNLNIDEAGRSFRYDLVVITSDLVVPKNIRCSKVVMIQEGMTDPETFMYHLVKKLKLPRYLASTSTQGLSDLYDVFCVGSEGYKRLFISKGVDKKKIRITGIPNYDNAAQFLDNDFPHKNYVLAATSDTRETLKLASPTKFLKKVRDVAAGRQIIVKLHPNEKVERSTKAIKSIIPDALIFTSGNTEHMIANCDVLLTQYSTVVYLGIALGKEVHSYFDVDALREMMPVQNGGNSGYNISEVCRELLAVNPDSNNHHKDIVNGSLTGHNETRSDYADRYSRSS